MNVPKCVCKRQRLSMSYGSIFPHQELGNCMLKNTTVWQCAGISLSTLHLLHIHSYRLRLRPKFPPFRQFLEKKILAAVTPYLRFRKCCFKCPLVNIFLVKNSTFQSGVPCGLKMVGVASNRADADLILKSISIESGCYWHDFKCVIEIN